MELPVQNEEGTVTVEGLSVGVAAGCTKTPRSTSEGSLRVGPDTLATWSSTQEVAALRSAVSEYHSMVRCANEASGMASTIRELGHDAHERIWTDAAGARGLALRSGSGAIKRMETKYFCLQQKKKKKELRIYKIRGTINPADLMTTDLDWRRLTTLCSLLSLKHIG